MNFKYLSVCLFVVFVSLVNSADPLCKTQTMCSCDTENGMIDLSPLSSEVLKCNDDKGSEMFQYSPCSWNKTSCSSGAVICMESLVVKGTIATSSGQTFVSTPEGGVAIQYQGEDNTTAIVVLKCDQAETDKLSFTGEKNKQYTFELASAYACVGGAVNQTTTPKNTKTTTNTPKTTTNTPKTTSKTTSKTTGKTTTNTPKTSPSATTSNTTAPSSTNTTMPTTSPHMNTTMTGSTTPLVPSNTTHSGNTTMTPATQTTPGTPTTPKQGASTSVPALALIAVMVFVSHQWAGLDM